MILSKKDFFAFKEADTIANIHKKQCGNLQMFANLWYGNDSYRSLRYLYALRKYEYRINCCKSPIGRILVLSAKVKWHRLGAKYNISILPNTVGYGLRIPHLNGGVIINCKSMGNYCTVNSGVVVGNNDRGELAQIGDGVNLTIGCKIIGGVHIGNNATIAPNSVVIKDVAENAVVTGVPSVLLKFKK